MGARVDENLSIIQAVATNQGTLKLKVLKHFKKHPAIDALKESIQSTQF